MTTEYTTHLRLPLPDFNTTPWHTLMQDAITAIDTAIYNLLLNASINDWANATPYTVGITVRDSTTNVIYICSVNHTSAAAPTTFAQDRIAHPTYWTSLLSNVQPLSSVLTALAALADVPAANKLPYFTGVNASALTDFTAFARTILDDANAAAVRTTISAQQLDATLTALASLVGSANKLPYFTGLDALALADLTAAARTLLALGDPGVDGLVMWDDSDTAYKPVTMRNGIILVGTELRAIETYFVALGDETTSLTVGTNKTTMAFPFAFNVTSVFASLATASTAGLPTFDINENGTTILSTKLTIDANEKTSLTALTPAVISDAALAAGAEIGFDIDVAGTGAKGAKIAISGYQ